MAVNECTHSQPSSSPDSHSKLMCESMDPFTRQMFPPTTVEEIEHLSPELLRAVHVLSTKKQGLTDCGYWRSGMFLIYNFII